jgi:hypothetical protein
MVLKHNTMPFHVSKKGIYLYTLSTFKNTYGFVFFYTRQRDKRDSPRKCVMLSTGKPWYLAHPLKYAKTVVAGTPS